MEPFTLQWWIVQQNECFREMERLRMSEIRHCLKKRMMLNHMELLSWIQSRIIKKYGE